MARKKTLHVFSRKLIDKGHTSILYYELPMLMTCRYVGVVGVVAVLHVYSLRENIFCTLLLKSEWVCRRDTLI